MIRILIADDHAIVRAGLKQFIADQVDMEVAAEAPRGFEAGRRRGSLGSAGPGCGWSEEPMTGVDRSAALDCGVAPECPPGPVPAGVSMSVSSCR